MEEFHPGDLVWFDPDIGYMLPGEVVEYSIPAQVVTVQAIVSGKTETFTIHKPSTVKKREDLGESGIPDMIQMNDLCESAILWNLKIRYDKQQIYTYIGSILLALNPYRMYDVYGVDVVKKYEDQIIGTLPPHLFAIASAAYSRMSKERQNQVVVISGESGSGKTESTKLILQYLAAVNQSNNNVVTEQILEASPLLEAFGNAKTVKNDNSSRFGKYMEVFFKDGIITGANTTEYLLEKSRIVTQAPDERNYHVFYEILAGLSETEKEKYGLQTAEKYFYLNQGGSYDIGCKNDLEDYRSLLAAMQVLGFSSEEQDVIFRMLASVLHLGNVYFHRKALKHGQEGVEVGSEAEIRWASHLLQLSVDGILLALTTKTTEARGERMLTPLNIDQALDARDAIAKALYSTLFSWLVQRINSIVCKGVRKTSIAILDIFGFEDFKENSFEQLCINFANENLQHHFNKTVFKLEQAEYLKEKIEWQPITFPDNHLVLQLIAKKPVGIIHLLDDESNFPKATDMSFLEKCHYNHALNELYSRPRMSSMEFGIKHYAGQVWYSVEGFLDKNRDTLRADVLDLLISSKITMVSRMFQHRREFEETGKVQNRADGRFVTMKPRAPTVAARFHDSLQNLLDTMTRCHPWFIRSFKPNNDKAAMKFDVMLVLEQLRYSGVLDTVRIRKMGYPTRYRFLHFAERYRCLAPPGVPRAAPPKEICRMILEKTKNSKDQYQLGTSKVFLREAMEQALDQERAAILQSAVVTIQRHVRRYQARKHFKTQRKSAVKIQSAYRGYRERKKYRELRKGVVKAQAQYRMIRQRREYEKIKAILERKREADRLAEERAKERQREREEQERERVSRATAGINHLEIPAELAFIFTKLDDWQCAQVDKNVVKVTGPVSRAPKRDLRLPADIDQHPFAKFTNIYFKSHVWAMKREPIRTPFLAKANEADHQESLALFKLILRFMNDNNLNGKRERALGDYIVQRGLDNPSLRDEIYCQLCNQTWQNDNDENRSRGWLLMANCLSCFPPSRTLYKYLLKYVSDHGGEDGYAAHCQRLLLHLGALDAKLARTYPPCLMEWRANTKKLQMALPALFYDEWDRMEAGDRPPVGVHPWMSSEQFANEMLHTRGIDDAFGWSTDLVEGDTVYSMNGSDYLLDLISETEIAPAFPTCKSYFLVSHDRSKEGDLPQSAANMPHNPDRYNVYEVDHNDLPPLPAGQQSYVSNQQRVQNGLRHDSTSSSSGHTPVSGGSSGEGKRLGVPPPLPSQPPPSLNTKQGLGKGGKNSQLNGSSITIDGMTLDRPSIKADVLSRSQRSRSMEDLLDEAHHNDGGGDDSPLALSKRSALNGRYFGGSQTHLSAGQHDLREEAMVPLSTTSRLNQRYNSAMEGGAGGSGGHPANGSPPQPANRNGVGNQNNSFGLSSSALNDRYFNDGMTDASGQRRVSPDSFDAIDNYEYPVTMAETINAERDIDHDNRYSRGNSEVSRYVKKPRPGKRGSRSARSSECGVRSSAMSDTSEAPSLASHVRNVRIPTSSHTSDLDQYLDELFMPVLDANMDDQMSDARSLAPSIKGGRAISEDYRDDESSMMMSLSDAHVMARNIKGTRKQHQHDDDDDDLSALFDAEKLAGKIKGVGQTEQPQTVSHQTSTPLSHINPALMGSSQMLNFAALNSPSIGSPVAGSPFGASTSANQSSGASAIGMRRNKHSSAAGNNKKGNNTNTTPNNSNNNNFYNLPLYNVSGMTVPIVDASQLIQQQVLQQHMLQLQQRAFLANAVQQNLQIQQQLMQQSAALQQMLNSTAMTSPTSPQPSGDLLAQVDGITSPAPLLNLPPLNLSAAFGGGGGPLLGTDGSGGMIPPPPPLPFPQTPTSGPTTTSGGGHKFRDSSAPSQKSAFQNVLSELKSKANSSQQWSHGGPPPPPPLPLSPNSARRQAADLYGRAKTIRIGKWRWPPPRDEEGNCLPGQPTSFNEFKRLKKEAKKQAKRDAGLVPPDAQEIEVSSSDDDEDDFPELMVDGAGDIKMSNGADIMSQPFSRSKTREEIIRAFEGETRPDPGSIGKLRISSEMRSKLEALTMDHSVRSKSSSTKVAANLFPVTNKLNEDRKLALERQLSGWSDQQGHKWTDGKGTISADSDAGTQASFKVDNLVKSKIKKMERHSMQQQSPMRHHGSGYHHYDDQRGGGYMEDDGRSPGKVPSGRNHLGPPPPPPMNNAFDPSVPVVPRHRNPPNALPLQQSQLIYHSGRADIMEFEDGGDFLKAMDAGLPADHSSARNANAAAMLHDAPKTKLYSSPTAPFITYTKVEWELRIRKEVFAPGEQIESAKLLHIVFAQIVHDVFSSICIRLTKQEVAKLKTLLDGLGFTRDNVNAPHHKVQSKRAVVEAAKELPMYFCRVFPVSGGRHLPKVQGVGISHSGIRLVRRERDNARDYFKVLDTIGFDEVADISLPRVSTVQVLLRNGGWLTLYSPKAPHIHSLIHKFVIESTQGTQEYVRAIADYVTSESSLLSFRKGEIIRLVKHQTMNLAKGWVYGVTDNGEAGLFPVEYVVPLHGHHHTAHSKLPQDLTEQSATITPVAERAKMLQNAMWIDAHKDHRDATDFGDDSSLENNPAITQQPDNGKHSMLQFAMFHFREALERYEMLRTQGSIRGSVKMMESIKTSNKGKKKKGDSDWTWKELAEMVKFSKSPIQTALLNMDAPELNKLAIDCFLCIMRYMGDYPMAKNQLEVDCVYSVLAACHNYPALRDEVYCQLVKQTTNNKSSKPDSCQKGWRLFSIVASYFDCSETLKPYLVKYLETAAYDKRRAYHGTAMVCLKNFRKTLKYGGRKNVPSIEEIAAISAGRNSKRQMYRLPGGTERVINTKSTTVVEDILDEICSVLGVRAKVEREEFSLYCIVEGDPFTMPLSRDEYILDVTTELLKNGHTFYLIFCRSVWYFPLRLDNPLYIEVIFNQVAPDYLEGLLLVTQGEVLPEAIVMDIAQVAAYLHRAADMQHMPSKDEVKYLLPKPVLPMKEIKPPMWVEKVQHHWPDMLVINPTEAKAQCLDILQRWPLFGSCFFAVKWMRSDTAASEHILALNRDGIHFLDVATHETIWMYPFSEVISTRKVRAEDGTLYLDMKCGNLMVQKITRIQTDQAHEISRLVRQYINIIQAHKGGGDAAANKKSNGNA